MAGNKGFQEHTGVEYKLSTQYTSPYKILQCVNEVSFKLDLQIHRRTCLNHMSHLKPVISDFLATTMLTITPPSPLNIEGQAVWIVRSIVNSCRRQGKLEYLDDWEGYGPKEQCWVPVHNILVPLLFLDFHSKHPEKPGPHFRG